MKRVYALLTLIVGGMLPLSVAARCPDTAPQPPTKEEDFFFCVSDETMPLTSNRNLIAEGGRDNLPQRLGQTLVFHNASKFKFGLGFGHTVGHSLAMHVERIGEFEGHGIYKLSDELGFIIRAGGGNAATRHRNGRINQAGNGQFVRMRFPSGSEWITSADSLGTRIEIEPLLLKSVPAGNPIASPARVKIASVRFEKVPESPSIGRVVQSGDYEYDVFLDLSSYAIRSQLKTCSLASSPNVTLKFPTVGQSSFPNVGSLVYGASTQIQLDCSQAGGNVTPYAVLHDVQQPNNRSDELNIETGAGKATGIKIKLFKDNDSQALRYGPQSNLKDTENWWKFADRGISHPNIRLTGYYVRTGTITPGNVNAQATITFSYQ